MFFEEYDKISCLTPRGEQFIEEGVSYRWTVQIPLPFPFPTQRCFHQHTTIEDRAFTFSIHNRTQRTFVFCKTEPPSMKVFLSGKDFSKIRVPDACEVYTEPLISVAEFVDDTTHESLSEAFADTDRLVKGCTTFLSAYLCRCQSFAPFACAWLVHPLSFNEIPSIIFSVLRVTSEGASVVLSSPAFIMGKDLENPIFWMDPPNLTDVADPLLELPYELMAESVQSLRNGTVRTAVLSSATAVEILATNVYQIEEERALRGDEDGTISKWVNEHHWREKEQLKYLVHRGLKRLNGRSLQVENQRLYDELLKWKELRNEVAHAGRLISMDAAKTGIRTCAEAIQWLGNVAGKKVKPFLPQKENCGAINMVAPVVGDRGFQWKLSIFPVTDDKRKWKVRFQIVGALESFDNQQPKS